MKSTGKNQKLKRLIVLSMIFFLSFMLASLNAAGVEEKQLPHKTVMVTDMRQREVAVPQDIERIIALEANALRLLSYFDAINKVVAVEDTGHGREKTVHEFFYLATYRIAHPNLKQLPSIGTRANHEAIIASDADIVFCSLVDTGQLDQLQQILGIPVFGIDADVEMNDLERFLDQIIVVGKVLKEEKRAEELASGIQALIDDLSLRAKQVTEAKRAYAGGMMYYGPADVLRTTGDYIPFDLTGAKNVMPTNRANNRQPYMTSLEDLIFADPDYVFIDSANNTLSTSGYLANKAILDTSVSAFRQQNVYTTLVYKYYGTNWENQLINCYYVGKVLYPRLYEDIMIEEKAEQIWELFFNVPLRYAEVAQLQSPALGRADWF